MDGTVREVCGECGFDAGDWTVWDAGSFFGALGLWWRLATAGVDASALRARPAPGVWSALEYGLHSAFVTAVLREGIERLVAEDGVALPELPDAAGQTVRDEALALDVAPTVADLGREGGALAALARRAGPDAWAHTGTYAGGTVQAEAALLHAVHDASHHMMDVGRGLASIGAGAPAARGEVAGLHASGGGVPKLPVPRGVIGRRGLEGDVQASRKHHGRPFQALCLWSSEVIDGLAAAGHPIGPGSAGENVTVSGLDWAVLRPGARLRLGTALAEVSFPATPCAKQTRWFADGDFGRIDHERDPAMTRWYAWVREPGEVAPGAQVLLQPPDPLVL